LKERARLEVSVINNHQKEVQEALRNLREIALKPDALSSANIDILIISEEQQANPGWQERVRQLKDARIKQAEFETTNLKLLKARLLANETKPVRTDCKPCLCMIQMREIVFRPSKNVRKMELGTPRPGMAEKVIMLVGATGAGKRTLINGFVNYVFGVEWEDDFRFVLVSDESNDQSKSQTQFITSYTLHH
jgi:flagellar biosynthesis GTPase FlhF